MNNFQLLLFLVCATTLAANAEPVGCVRAAAFVSEDQIVLLLEQAEGSYVLAVSAGCMQDLRTLAAFTSNDCPFLVATTAKEVFICRDQALYAFAIDGTTNNCYRASKDGRIAGVVGSGQYIFVEQEKGIVPWRWLARKIPYIRRSYCLLQRSDGQETANAPVSSQMSLWYPLSVPHVVVNMDEKTFAVIEKDVGDIPRDVASKRVEFTVRAFTLDLQEKFRLSFPGYPHGLRMTDTGGLVVLAYSYEDSAYTVYEVECHPDAKRPETRILTSFKWNGDIDKARSTSSCVIVSTGSRLTLHAIESGSTDSADLEPEIDFDLSPGGKRLVSWVPGKRGSCLNVYDISECRLKHERVLRLDTMMNALPRQGKNVSSRRQSLRGAGGPLQQLRQELNKKPLSLFKFNPISGLWHN